MPLCFPGTTAYPGTIFNDYYRSLSNLSPFSASFPVTIMLQITIFRLDVLSHLFLASERRRKNCKTNWTNGKLGLVISGSDDAYQALYYKEMTFQ